MEQLESRDYASDHLPKGLNDLRKQGSFSDVTIIIDNRRFQAHKIVLSASSTYFNSMFTSGFQESRNSEVEIGVGSAEAFEEILEFAYTGRFRVSPETFSSFLQLAFYMDFKYAIKESVESMKNKLAKVSLEDGLELYCLAECHEELTPLVDPLMKILVKNFIDLARTNIFMGHASKDFLVSCLDMREIETDSQNEEKLFSIILDWLFHDWEQRKQHAFDVLKEIRLGLIPTDDMDRMVMGDRLKSILDIPKCKKLFEKVTSLRGNNSLGLLRLKHRDLFATRNTMKTPVYTEVRHATVSLHFRSQKGCCRFQKSARFPGLVPTDFVILKQFGHGYSLVVVAGQVYVAGGIRDVRDRIDDQPYTAGEFYKYDPDINKWSSLPPMPTPDCYPLLVEMDGYIYAVGCSSQRYASRNAQRFHIASEKWESIKPLNVDLNDTSGVVCDGYLLVAGSSLEMETSPFGVHDYQENRLYVYVTAYNPSNNQWTKVYQSYVPLWMLSREVQSRWRQYPVQIFRHGGGYFFQSVKFHMHPRGLWQITVEEVIFECTDPENLLFTLGEELDQQMTFGGRLAKKEIIAPSQLICIDVRKWRLNSMPSCSLPHSRKDLFWKANEGW